MSRTNANFGFIIRHQKYMTIVITARECVGKIITKVIQHNLSCTIQTSMHNIMVRIESPHERTVQLLEADLCLVQI